MAFDLERAILLEVLLGGYKLHEAARLQTEEEGSPDLHNTTYPLLDAAEFKLVDVEGADGGSGVVFEVEAAGSDPEVVVALRHPAGDVVPDVAVLHVRDIAFKTAPGLFILAVVDT